VPEKEAPGEAIDELHRRVTGVEERAMESLEIEIDAQQQTLRDISLRQDLIEAKLEELSTLHEEYGRERSALMSASESMLTRIETLQQSVEQLSRRASHSDEIARASTYQDTHRSEPAAPAGELIDLNAASFDDLRGLGLSVTQAARLIARRDAVNGFSSPDEVAELPGFPKAQLSELLSRTRV
jgi:hypothetical protein